MQNQLNEDLLKYLFGELGLDFDEWADMYPLWTTWTDQQIYNALPQDVKDELGDILMNYSWYHGGM